MHQSDYRQPRTPTDAIHAYCSVALLAQLGAALDQPDPAAVWSALPSLLVPAIADVVCIEVLQPDGWLKAVVCAHCDPHKHVLMQELATTYPRHLPVGSPDRQQLERGETRFFTQIKRDHFDAHTHNTQHANALLALNMHAGALIPLRSQGQLVGQLHLGMVQPDRSVTDIDPALLTDIAQRIALSIAHQQAQVALHETQRGRDATLAMAAHELSTPLTTLIAQAQLLQRRLNSAPAHDERIAQGVALILQQSKRMHVLIDTLLTSAQAQTLPLLTQTLDLNQLALSVHTNFSAMLDSHHLQLELSPTPVIIHGDHLLLDQALQNLVQNAVKYSPSTITLRLSRTEQHAIISVSDTGIGIPHTERTRIFERFYRAPNAVHYTTSGVGIGLHVVQAIIQQHGGSIRAEETPGGGATFVILLPLQIAP
jgi:signal transduction histidine kinase